MKQRRKLFSPLFLFVVIAFFSSCDSSKDSANTNQNTSSEKIVQIESTPTKTKAIPLTKTQTPINTKTIEPTIKATRIISSETPTRTPAPHPLQAQLPEECQFDYARYSFDMYEYYHFNAEACNDPVISPDSTKLFYITVDRIDDSERGSHVVKYQELPEGDPKEIYRSQNFAIRGLEWSSTGKLVFSDRPIEGFLGLVVIYDPGDHRIIQEVNGSLWGNSWNQQASAFYTKSFDADFGPHCETYIGGFDFVTNRLLPSEKLIVAQDEIIRVSQGPYWIEDGQALIFAARKSIANSELEEKSYGPSMILMIKLDPIGPRIVTLKSDPEIDFFLIWQENGTYEITEELYQPLSCWDIYIQENDGDF